MLVLCSYNTSMCIYVFSYVYVYVYMYIYCATKGSGCKKYKQNMNIQTHVTLVYTHTTPKYNTKIQHKYGEILQFVFACICMYMHVFACICLYFMLFIFPIKNLIKTHKTVHVFACMMYICAYVYVLERRFCISLYVSVSVCMCMHLLVSHA